jgi:hypothetical protein
MVDKARNDVIAIAGSQFDSTSDLAEISNFRRDYTVATSLWAILG